MNQEKKVWPGQEFNCESAMEENDTVSRNSNNVHKFVNLHRSIQEYLIRLLSNRF